MSSIEEVLKARIVALGTAAGSNVFREVIEQEPTMPAISFTRTGGTPMRRAIDTGLPTLERANFRVEIIANTSASAESVAAALRAGLDGWRDTSTNPPVLRCALSFQGDASYVDGDMVLKIVQHDYELVYR